MRGIVLAAGGGTRLRPLTDALPKTLLPVAGDRTILDLALGNLAEVGVEDVTIVVGHAAEVLRDRLPTLEERYDLSLHERSNERFGSWNNAYSLWLVRDVLADGALIVNGDTVHPVSVEERLLDARGLAPVVLALDDVKVLGDEEMKVVLGPEGRLARISKQLPPSRADGEYIGVTLLEPAAADDLASALQATFERDPDRYYEDGFQEFADRGGTIRTASIGKTEWVEVDDHADLARAKEVACRY